MARMFIYVPTCVQHDERTGIRRKYIYVKQRKHTNCVFTNPEFVEFFRNHVHTATDDLNDVELRGWIHNDYDEGEQHPIFEYIMDLYERK